MKKQVSSHPPAGGVNTSRSVGAVVVTFNSAATIERCIRSLRAAEVSDIVVVDNASSDDSVSCAEELGVTVISNQVNVGFAAACNQGAALLLDHPLLFLNPDAWLKDGSLVRALAQFSDPAVGIVGLQLVSPTGVLEVDSIGPEVTIWHLITRTVCRSHPPAGKVSGQSSTRAWVSGGAMLIRGDVWRQVHGFDPQFFLYWEDVDLCKRVRSAGWQVFQATDAYVEHERGVSFSNVVLQTKHYDTSADRYFYKHYATPIWLLQRLARRLYRLVSPRVS